LTAYCNYSDGPSRFYDWRCRFDKDEEDELNSIYSFLEKIGYEMSEEERALLDGTHELYVRDEGD
jgi:ParB family chromosome partitioning protein